MTSDRVSDERLAIMLAGARIGAKMPGTLREIAHEVEQVSILTELQHLRSPVTVSDEMVERGLIAWDASYDDQPPLAKDRNEFMRAALTAALVPAEQEGESDYSSDAAAIEIADAVIAWMVKYDLLDADQEYRDDGIIEVLNDLRPVTSTPGGDNRVVARWLVEETLPSGAMRWQVVEHEHHARTLKTEFPATVTALVSLSSLEAAERENERLKTLNSDLIMQARGHAQEARTANGTIYEIYQAISGGKGEPGNWNGAQPVRDYIATAEASLAAAREALEKIAEATDPDDPESYRSDDREGCLDMVQHTARAALAGSNGE